MLRAIEEMRKSVAEPRKDGKPTPKVGVVLRTADGKLEFAHRGELRDGDHAEFTLLERKNRATKLDGAALFCTLEPCAPGARHPPKLACSERIVLARIKNVWVGIEDPDPTVDGKGIGYMRANLADVQMFPKDLQDVIRAENADFFAAANERAAAPSQPESAKLSALERAVTGLVIDNLDEEALNRYRSRAGISDAIDSDAFRDRLVREGLLARNADGTAATGMGALLFGKHPRQFVKHAGLMATIHRDDGTVETRDFDDALVLIPERFEDWLRNKLPDVIDRSTMQRSASGEVPFELIREGVVNALLHRDYGVTGAKCQIEITPETIVIKSPGKPPRPITLEQIQSLRAPTLSRNPHLTYVFSRMKLAEERGLGMLSFNTRPAERGLPLPTFSFDGVYLVLTLFRHADSAVQTLPDEIRNEMNRDEQAGWAWLSARTGATRAEYAAGMGFDDRKSQRHLKRFLDLGLVSRSGAGPATRYEVRR